MEKERVELLLERTFLFDPNVYMSIVLTIEGDVSEEELCEAVRKTYTQNQTTMSKVVLDEQGKVYLEKMSETGCKVFVDKRDWLEILRENERKPFRLEEGELIRIFIIPRGKQKDIYIMAHHVSGDGGAMLILAEDIFSNLEGRKVEYKPTKVITAEESVKKGNLNFLEKAGLKKLSQKWAEEEKQFFGWDDYYKAHEEYWENRRTEIGFHEIEGDRLDNLKAECKKLGVTINTYLVTKLMQEYYPESKKLGIPISVRGEERSISCLVSSATPRTKYDTNKEFVENLVAIDKAIKKDLKNEGEVYRIPQFVAISDPTLVCAAYIHNVMRNIEGTRVNRMSEILGLYGNDRVDLGITNLREITYPNDYDRFKVTNVVPIAPLIATTEHLFTISTYNGKMMIAETKVRKM